MADASQVRAMKEDELAAALEQALEAQAAIAGYAGAICGVGHACAQPEEAALNQLAVVGTAVVVPPERAHREAVPVVDGEEVLHLPAERGAQPLIPAYRPGAHGAGVAAATLGGPAGGSPPPRAAPSDAAYWRAKVEAVLPADLFSAWTLLEHQAAHLLELLRQRSTQASEVRAPGRAAVACAA